MEQEDRLKKAFFSKARALHESILPDILKSNFGILEKVQAEWENCSAKTSVSQRACNYCCVPWSSENHRTKMVAAVAPGRGMKRILRKLKRKKPLCLFEKRLVQRLHDGNWVEITCLVCHKKTKTPVKKPVKQSRAHKPARQQPVSTPAKKKKTKKKDKTAGLITPTVAKPAELIDLCETIDIDDDSVLEITMSATPKTTNAPTTTLPNFIPIGGNNKLRNEANASTPTLPNFIPIGGNNKLRKESNPSTPTLPNFIPIGGDNKVQTKSLPKRQKEIVMNPFAVANRPSRPNSFTLKKEGKKIKSLQRMLNTDNTRSSKSPSLKDFLKKSL